MTARNIPKDWEHFKPVFLEVYPRQFASIERVGIPTTYVVNMSVAEFVEKFEDMTIYSN